MSSHVIALFITPTARAPMIQVPEALCVAGSGIAGDRYEAKAGSFSKKRPEFRPISFISCEALARANAQREDSFLPADTRRNVLVSLGVEALNALLGQEFSIGAARFLGVELCTPCRLPSDLCGKPDFKEAFEGMGGLRAQILTGGRIAPGDALMV